MKKKKSLVKEKSLIKARDIKAGMVIGFKRKIKYDDICLIVAKEGFTKVEYTFLDYQDSYFGACCNSIEGETLVKVIKGNLRKMVIEAIKKDLFKNYFDIKQMIDIVRLIEDMERK